MSGFFAMCRKTASRVYKRKNDPEDELHPLQGTMHQYSSACFSLYKACIVGDVQAVRWYIDVGKFDVNKPDKDGILALFYAIQKNHVVLVKDLIQAGADVNVMGSFEEGTKIAAAHVAAKYNRCDCMQILLDHGADPDVRNCFGQTPLHTAIRRKLKEVVKMLIEIGKADVNIVDHDKVTPLHLAASSGDDSARQVVVKTLLDNGANPFCEDNEGNTVFHEAAENGVDDVLEMLFQRRGYEKNIFRSISDVLNLPRKDGYNCLHLAVENGHEKVIQMCIDHKANVNLKSLNGDHDTPLHIACAKGRVNACKMLLDNGADIDATNKSNQLAIHIAATKGHVECLSYLIEKGTNVDVFHYCGPALVSASYCRRGEAVRYLLEAGASPTMRNQILDTCLHVAVRNGDVETVSVIMEKCSEELLELEDKDEKTALHLAAKNGNAEVLKILLSHNPDIRASDDRGKNPIHIAAENGNVECAKLLLERDKYGVHVTDFMWRTPLHLACSSGRSLELVKLLLEYGADVNARDDRRWTPLLYISSEGCPYSVAELVEHGARIDEWDKNRMTALSLAACENQPYAVKELLKHGADPSILNVEGLSCMDIALNSRFHDVCMAIANSDRWKEALVSCTTMERCLEVSPEVAKVILDRCVEYSGKEIDKDYKVTYHFDLLDPNPDSDDAGYYGPLVMKLARRSELLAHPLTKKLIQVNWRNGVRYIYYSEMILLGLFMIYLSMFVLWLRELLIDCHDATNNTGFPVGYLNEDSFCTSKVDYDPDNMFTSRLVIFVYFVAYLAKELKQLWNERWEYFKEITNILDISMSVLFLLFIQLPSENMIAFNRLQFGILGIFSYYFLMFMWTRGFSRWGIYIVMFLEVLQTLVKVLSGFALLAICFALAFHLAFTKGDLFQQIPGSLLKVMSMLMGELDYSGISESASDLPADMENIAVFLFIIFCLTMTLVVNNLLIGLAVGDIESIQKNAEIKLLSLQVSQIVQARAKMVFRVVRRKFHVSTITDMPNKNERNCQAEEHRRAKYKIRSQKMKDKKKKIFESIMDLAQPFTKNEKIV